MPIDKTIAERIHSALREVTVTPFDHRLDPNEVIIRTDFIRPEDINRVYRNIARYGFCRVMLSRRDIDHLDLMNYLVRQLGIPSKKQNHFHGTVKQMRQTFDVGPGTGVSAYTIPSHSDGTQTTKFIDLVMFGYTSHGSAGGETGLTDMVSVLIRLAKEAPERYCRILERLSDPKAAVFSKQGMTYEGPIFSVNLQGRLNIRFRQDHHVSINPNYQQEWDWLREAINDPRQRLTFLPSLDEFIIVDNLRILHDREKVLGDSIRSHERAWIEEFAGRRTHPLGIWLDPISIAIAVSISNR